MRNDLPGHRVNLQHRSAVRAHHLKRLITHSHHTPASPPIVWRRRRWIRRVGRVVGKPIAWRGADGPDQRDDPSDYGPAHQEVEHQNPTEVVGVTDCGNDRRKKMQRQHRQTEKRKEQKVHGMPPMKSYVSYGLEVPVEILEEQDPMPRAFLRSIL